VVVQKIGSIVGRFRWYLQDLEKDQAIKYPQNRALQRSALTFLDRSGLSENHQGGKTGGPTIWMPILNSRVKLLAREKVPGV